ncbi:MAG: 3-oxoadipate enol-lactonase [Paracoccaceae bacterium]
MNVFETEDVRLHWREDGDPSGAPVLFANSLGTDLRLWDAVLPLLPRGLRFVRYDKRGHGLSDCPDGPYTMETLTADAAALIEGLALGPVAVVGLSIGGMIAQGLAAGRPDLVNGAVLSCTAARMGTPEIWEGRMAAVRAGGIDSIADAVMERWFSPSFRASPKMSPWRNMLTRTPVAGYLGCSGALATADLTSSTPGIDRPVMAIAGEVDGSSPPAVVKATADLIKGARFHTVPGVGHLPCVEAPEAYAALISPFLKEVMDV